MKRCSNCGSENRRDAIFCSSCGFELNSGGSNSWWKKQSQTSKFLIATGLPMIIILFIAVAATFFTDHSTDYSDDYSYDTLDATGGSALTESYINKFEGNGISFSYPETWNIYTPENRSSDTVVDLKSYDMGINSIMTVYKKPYTLSAETLKEIWLEVCYEKGDSVEYVKEIEVDGNRAYAIKSSYYSDGCGDHEYIVFTDGKYEYSLLFTSDDISLIQDDINTIIRSFRVE
ncbi:PsbP-related protein [Methanothermobacter sp. K4]|uniref:PsbP-related protein n=1 Tax=Methanothermobacter sp. K4 TaxID=2913262 RepID=UPI001EDAA5C2|nr:PsbP-related protein [Methanothermobacter sp. K4]MCG2828514.1 zinc-ribbon domain-containing protein [Methanothermobacter sp. K4]